jgi:protein-tyrosine phosphatase
MATPEAKPYPKFKYIMTTRFGLNDKGIIRSLEFMPPWFHPFVTVASAAANKAAIKAKYPTVKYMTTPDWVNTASAKRKYIFETVDTAVKDIVLINDETAYYVVLKNGKVGKPVDYPDDFRRHLVRFEELSRGYVGFSVHTRLFSNTAIDKKVEVVENKFIGSFFKYERKFALEKLKLGRLNYHEDVDYTLQTLSLGYKTANYVGILFANRTNKPRRHLNDRTLEVQKRDSAKLKSFFPHAVEDKEDYDPVEQDMDLKIKWSRAYAPHMKVLFVCHGNINRSAAGEIILSKMKRTFDVRSCAVKDNAGGELTARKTRTALAELGYQTEGVRSTKATQRLMNWADIVFYMDKGNLSRLSAQFPESRSKFVNLGSCIGIDKIDDPGFTSDPKVVMRVTTQIRDSIKAWSKSGCPLPAEKPEVVRGSLF